MCAKIQTVELDNLDQHGFDFQLAVLNEVCFIILRVRARRIDANVLTLTRMNCVMCGTVGPPGALEKALEGVFVGGRKQKSSSKICCSLDIGGTGGDRGCLPKWLHWVAQARTLATTFVHRRGGRGGRGGTRGTIYFYFFPPALYKNNSTVPCGQFSIECRKYPNIQAMKETYVVGTCQQISSDVSLDNCQPS